MGGSENPCTRLRRQAHLRPDTPLPWTPDPRSGGPLAPLVGIDPTQSGPSSRVGTTWWALTWPQAIFRAPWGPLSRVSQYLWTARSHPQSGRVRYPPGHPPGGGLRPPREGVPSEGKLGVPGPPRRTPREGGPRPPGPGTPPGGPPGGPGPGGVHFRGYLITLPVGTDVAIRFRKGWFLGGEISPPGARRAPSRGVRDPPGGGSRDPPPRGSKKGVFLTLRRPPKMGHF